MNTKRVKKIFYFHGFSSSGNSSTTKILQLLLSKKATIIAPDIPIDPHDALLFLRNLCNEHNPDLVLGLSMGAMYAQQMHGHKKILINPSFHVSKNMSEKIGRIAFMNPRIDNQTHFEITPALCDLYREVESSQFKGIRQEEKDITWALFATNDELVDCSKEYLEYYIHHEFFPGGHFIGETEISQYIIPHILSTLNI